MNEVIPQLAAAVTAMGPTHEVELAGEWSTSNRKTYGDSSQLGSGDGPFIDVVDAQWRAVLKCAVPMVGMAFMDTPATTFWMKAVAPAVDPAVGISLVAHAGAVSGHASFGANLFEAFVPAVPVAYGEITRLIDCCAVGDAHAFTGSAHVVAAVDDNRFVVLLLPRSLVEVGRKRLWHFRPEFASSLEGSLRIFAKGRAGTLQRATSDRRAGDR